MDAKRLEELAERLMLGEFTIEDQRDAARCAAAWAKVEREKASVTYQNGAWHCAFGWLTHTIEDTAIAAVEAAPEVGP